MKAVPIQPPGGVDACVKRFVAGEPDDRLDAVMVVSLPTESFQSSQRLERSEIHRRLRNLDAQSLDPGRGPPSLHLHRQRAGDWRRGRDSLRCRRSSFAERATGKKLISSNQWQAFEAVQTRVEAKLVAATKLYLATASIRDTTPLNPLDTAKALLDRGDGEDRDGGVQVGGHQQSRSAADDRGRAGTVAAQCGERAARTHARRDGGRQCRRRRARCWPTTRRRRRPNRRARIRFGACSRTCPSSRADSAYDGVIRSDVPALDHQAFVAMIKQTVQRADRLGARTT